MKKNFLNMVSALLVLLTLLSILCACGSDPSDKTDTSDEKAETTGTAQTKPILSVSSGEYGRTKNVDGITEYVDADGVTTVAVVSNAITVLKAEYIADYGSQGQPQYSSMYIGFDCRNINLPESCVLRAQVIASQTQPEEYNNL